MNTSKILAVIGGTGAAPPSAFNRTGSEEIQTPFGVSGVIQTGTLGQSSVCFLARHGPTHSVAPHRVNYRANIWALRQLGASDVLALNTVGGIHPQAVAGTLWLPDDLIDYSWGRESTFYDGTELELRHQEFARPYSPDMRQRVLDAACEAGVSVRDGGVYGCTQGPRLETAAEIRRMQRDGCDLVGMTGMPEAALAAELGLRYASLALVVNPAAGLGKVPITLDEILREAERCMTQAQRIVATLAQGSS